VTGAAYRPVTAPYRPVAETAKNPEDLAVYPEYRPPIFPRGKGLTISSIRVTIAEYSKCTT
ncbi:MAG: hypothetical protein RR216_02145, partial [Pseudoflavonifractor sp.]